MKYLLGLAIVTVALVGCETTSNHSSATTQQSAQANQQNAVKVINFAGQQGLKIQLKTADDFETAEMKDNSGKVYKLKRAVSGSGIRLVDPNGVAVHFKTNMDNLNEGSIELVPGNFQEIKEFKIN